MKTISGLSPSNRAFVIFVLSFVAGWTLVWLPLGLLAGAGVALLVSVLLARPDRADET